MVGGGSAGAGRRLGGKRVLPFEAGRDAPQGREGAEIFASDDALETWIRENCRGFFHPVSACRIGAAKDPMAVVDPACRACGVQGLRVVDAYADNRPGQRRRL